MKKARYIILTAALLIAVAAAGTTVYAVRTPEYALWKISRDVKKSGIEGLYPHLTADVKETLNEIISITESEMFGSIMDFLNKNDYSDKIISEIKEIKWSLNDILKGKNTAKVIVGFNYKDELTGRIEISMIRDKGDWKVSGIKFPKFDKIHI